MKAYENFSAPSGLVSIEYLLEIFRSLRDV